MSMRYLDGLKVVHGSEWYSVWLQYVDTSSAALGTSIAYLCALGQFVDNEHCHGNLGLELWAFEMNLESCLTRAMVHSWLKNS